MWQAATVLAPPAVGWDAIPAGKVSLDEGERWLKAGTSALLVVPSVIVSEECNVLINPLHPDTARIAAQQGRASGSMTRRLLRAERRL